MDDYGHKGRLIEGRLLPLVVIALFLCACQEQGATTVTQEPTLVAPSPTPDQSAEWQAWQSGPHAAAYDLSKGPNTYCSRCHSPANWDPAATIGTPPNCVSCKFAFEPQPRIAPSNPIISPADWKGVGCDVCHRVQDGVSGSSISWTNFITGYHETVSSSTELCEKCHTDTQTIRHKRELDGNAHSDYNCTQCHDPHSVAASCTAAGCHPDTMATPNPVAGHDAAHSKVSCVACHDASGLEVGPAEDTGIWITFRTTELLGRSNLEPYQSHNIQQSVECSRCHFNDNPWGLVEPVGVTEQ